MEAFSTFISLAGGDENLLDANGSTLIIHESADDHVTQPIGGAGARIACGIIEAN
jgi:Cu-Zn family superoxide dismutase